MTLAIKIALLVLICVGILFLIVIGVYLVRLIIDLNKLTNNLNDTTYMVKKEIEPILGELKTSLTTLNDFTKATNNKLSGVKKILTTLFGILGVVIGGIGKGGFFKGMVQGFKTFVRK